MARFKVGDKVRIGAEVCGHEFDIGEVVTIKDVHNKDYIAMSDNGGCWYITDREIDPAHTFQVGQTYKTASVGDRKCIHIENGLAWCVNVYSDGSVYGPAYTWDMDGNYQNAVTCDRHPYKVTLGPITERKTVVASVDYVDGVPDWGTVAVRGG